MAKIVDGDRPVIFFAVVLFLSGCQIREPLSAQFSASETGRLPQSTIDSQLAEATFRYQFTHNASGQQSSTSAFCIGYGANPSRNGDPFDPPKSFLARLSDIHPPVLPYSFCSSTNAGVIANETREPALIFTISSVKCADNSHCEVEGGYYEAPLSSSGNTYSLERKDGKWVVVKDTMHWIS
jgi:hypothetical protein